MPRGLKELPLPEVLFLIRLFETQKIAEKHHFIDFLPYTPQIEWITGRMVEKFPKGQWTEKLVHRTLLRLRKNDLMPDNGDEDPPSFPKDDDTAMND